MRRPLPAIAGQPVDPRLLELDGVAIANGRYFAQTAGSGRKGYAVEDIAGGYAFWKAFGHFGGINVLGYPISQPYASGVMRRQAFQRGVIVFAAAGSQPALENLFDELHAAGADPELAEEEGIPKLTVSTQATPPAGADPLAASPSLTNPAIKAWYGGQEGTTTIERYGLPSSMPERHGAFVFQRFQKVAVRVADGSSTASDVQVLLGGRLAAEFGLLPTAALTPLFAPPAQRSIDVTVGLPGGGHGPDPRFGGIAVSEADSQGIATATSLGLTWDREQFLWRTMDGPGLDLSKMARGDAHLFIPAKIVGLLQFTPPYANGGSSDFKLPPQNLDVPWNDPKNAWGQFVYAVVKQERGTIDTWALWNEPDICNPAHPGFAWNGTVDQFYQLTKVGYQAAKAANPDAIILLGSLGLVDVSCQTDNSKTTFFNDFLRIAAADPAPGGAGRYFDAVTLDLHKEPEWIYNLVSTYHDRMKSYGFDRPVWVMEMGVPLVDHPIDPASNDSLSVDADQQASFVIQGYANAIAAGADHVGLFPVKDYPPGSPGYLAARTAIRFMSNVTSAQKLPPVSGLEGNRFDGVVRIVMDGSGFQTTVVYNRSRQPVAYDVPATASQAIVSDKLGNERTVVAVQGVYHLQLEGTRGGYFAPWGEDVRFIGGSPLLVREAKQ